MSKHLLLIILVGILGGCAVNDSVGRKYDTTVVNRIELGKTTESEVIAMLGAPSSEQKLDNGIVVYYYSYGETKDWGRDSAIDSLQIQLYNGVVINKHQRLSHR